RNSDAAGKSRGLEGDLAHFNPALQKFAEGFAPDREAAWCRQYSRRQCAKVPRSGAGECAINQCRDRCPSLGGRFRPQADRYFRGRKRYCDKGGGHVAGEADRGRETWDFNAADPEYRGVPAISEGKIFLEQTDGT